MDRSDIIEQLATVNRAIAQTDPRVRVGGSIFLVWGLTNAAIDATAQAINDGHIPASWSWGLIALLLFSVIFTIGCVRGYRRSRSLSLIQREYLFVLWISMAVAAFATMTGSHFFSQAAVSAVWTIVCAIVTLYIGMHDNRAALLAGAVLLASFLAANAFAQISGYVLAAGMLLGYAGFGLYSMIVRD